MNCKCLICGQALNDLDYHPKCVKALFGGNAVPVFTYSVDELNRMAKELVLSRMSVPGVQAKLSIHLEKGREKDRLTLVGLDGNYILKLPTSHYPELPEAEHFAMLLARLCGIKTADFGLVRLDNGAVAYLTRRMDREDGLKHMEDMCQLTGRRTERKYYGSYEQIAKRIWMYSANPGQDVVAFFEEVLFCFLIGNSDMHLKNFSLIREHNGDWHLSNAYDLVPVKIVMPADKDDLALTINGKNRNLSLNDFQKGCETMRLTPVQFKRVVKRMVGDVHNYLEEAFDRSFLSDDFKSQCRALVRKRLSLFG